MKKIKLIKNKDSLGFTLMELMVVISIITFILSSIISVVTVARRSARDGKRKGDANQLQKAIVSFQIDNGYYPIANKSVSGTCDGTGVNMSTDIALNALLVPKYLAKLPKDPSNPSGSYLIPPFDYQYACASSANASSTEYGLLVPFANDINLPTCRVVEPLTSTLFNSYPLCK